MPEGERESDERKNRGEAGRGEVETKYFLDSRSHRSSLFLSPSHTKKANKRALGPFPRAQKASGTPFVLSTRMRSTMARGSTAAAAGPSSASMATLPPTLLLCFRRSFRRSCLASPGRPHCLRHGTHFPLSLAEHGVSWRSRASGRGLRTPGQTPRAATVRREFSDSSQVRCCIAPTDAVAKPIRRPRLFGPSATLFCPVSASSGRALREGSFNKRNRTKKKTRMRV